MPPRIGITCSPAMGVTQPIEKVGRLYIDGVVRAGGLPIVLPSLERFLAYDVVADLDGLLLTGGGDVDPSHYDQAPVAECGPPDPGRDIWELELVAAARDAELPILGICRGAQMLAVAFGGTLIQHLPARPDIGDRHDDLDRSTVAVHEVEVVAGSRLHRVVGATGLGTNTLHHQAVDTLGPDLVVSGVADDGIIEGIEAPDEPVLGVQWHPELMLDRAPHQRLFDWVVDPERAERG